MFIQIEALLTVSLLFLYRKSICGGEGKMKIRRFLSLMCASCIVLSMAAAASAASIEDDPYYCGVDWSQADTSMCISGTEYHRYEQPPALVQGAERAVFSGWVKGVPANGYPGSSQWELITG